MKGKRRFVYTFYPFWPNFFFFFFSLTRRLNYLAMDLLLKGIETVSRIQDFLHFKTAGEQSNHYKVTRVEDKLQIRHRL